METIIKVWIGVCALASIAMTLAAFTLIGLAIYLLVKAI